MEDTDRERSTQASVQAILDGLTWLGIDWDEGPGKGGPFGPYFQTERVDTYKKHADQLIADGQGVPLLLHHGGAKARREVAEKQKRQYKYEGTCRNRTDQPDKPFVDALQDAGHRGLGRLRRICQRPDPPRPTTTSTTG